MYHAGIRHVVISPGSRSTPLAYLFAEHPGIKTHVVIDERSAAFFAMGMAKISSHPVVLLCTSGTAGANYYPAIIEAKYARVPVIVLTADRPHELREVGAPQAIDQIHLYGKHVKWFVDLPQPNERETTNNYLQQTCYKAVNTSLQVPRGPVHLNVPLPEPLIPELPVEFSNTVERIRSSIGGVFPAESMVSELRNLLNSGQKGIIVAGELACRSAEKAVIQLAEAYDLPLIADPLSQLRTYGDNPSLNIMDTYDTFLRDLNIREKLKPDFVIRVGSMPVSKALGQFLQGLSNIRYIVIDEGGHRDPIHKATDSWTVSESLLIREVINEDQVPILNQEWLNQWVNLNEKVKTLVIQKSKELAWNEGKAVQAILESLPCDSLLYVGNSMPIRDVDTFLFKQNKTIQLLANRGTNGIDGVVSSSLGASVSKQPSFLLIGDLSFYHDLNGLLISQMEEIDITIFVLNNNGGGIFSYLSQSEQPYHFEKLFGTPANLTFENAVKMYNGLYKQVHNLTELKQALGEFNNKSGLKVAEIMTNREKNVEIHRDLWNFVSREMSNHE